MIEPTEIGVEDLRRAVTTGDVLNSGAPAAASGRPRIRAELIRQVCREFAGTADPRGLRIGGLRIDGALDLAGIRWPFPITFSDCEFAEAVNVEGAEVQALDLIDCCTPGLLANGLHVRRHLDLTGSTISGSLATSAATTHQAAVWLCEAEIGGQLFARGTRIDGCGERAIQADRLIVRGAVTLTHGFRADGEVRLLGARSGDH